MAHKFGGRWTLAKLTALRDYLTAYAIALKHQPFVLHYIDAFAGTGSYVPTKGDGMERLGSARIALAVPGFHEYHFIEMRPKRCRSLEALAARHSGQRIEILEGDANKHLASLCDGKPGRWKGSRAVLFLDPYGMQVEWQTLERIARTGAIDVWYLFPLSGVTRQLTRHEGKMDEDKRRSLDRVFGTGEWREAFYQLSPPDLFGTEALERHADSEAISEWITGRLRTIFPVVEGPTILRKGSKQDPNGGPPLFALYFLVASPSAKAQNCARDIGRGVMKKLLRDASTRTQISDANHGDLLK